MRKMILGLTTGVSLVLLSGMADADMKIIGGQITGIVIDAANEKPIPGAYVMVRWTGGVSSWGEAGSRCARATSVRADEGGKFTVPAWSKSDPGFVNLSAELIPYSPGFQDVGSRSAQGALPKTALGFIALDELELPPAEVTLRMKRFEGSDIQRAEYISRFLRATSCGSDTGGTRLIYKAIEQEIRRLPPEVHERRSGRFDGTLSLDEQIENYVFRLDKSAPATSLGEEVK
jgi:hypothetical protein